ncbi:MAG: DUF1566 domain-containing protein [Gammaproteobacteria bacterium]|nr:DUF1566 domain-containing protein [Gammaproteobacteria bacterium]MBU1492257.1 DUF1566 domain-containing protein [Gammaproteobacteria bacterium]MBU2066828.1 DUF1566 domain-containing protein [Gammaproteobacteria bacterium]MBU2137356.1 DUF1566 domain-containing protein [Gammaproteobacteria bacterium]MBU2215083.1 DUF1566 domain-containing protein [Gammaproteobacteria bacterium]
MQQITLEVGKTTITTQNAMLARQVLEQETGLSRAVATLIPGELTSTLCPPAIGQHWHGQGGTYVGVMRGVNGQADYHLVAPKHAQIAEITYGPRGKNIDAASCARDGLANTGALLASGTEHPAAQWAADQEAEGHRDFYLPSRAEAYLCWANIPEQFADKGWWLTSTQHGPDNAWFQYFDGGFQYYDGKVNARPAFAVRRILIPSSL